MRYPEFTGAGAVELGGDTPWKCGHNNGDCAGTVRDVVRPDYGKAPANALQVYRVCEFHAVGLVSESGHNIEGAWPCSPATAQAIIAAAKAKANVEVKKPAANFKPASEKQLNFIAKLISERAGKLTETQNETLDVINGELTSGCIDMKHASSIIDMLLSPEWKVAKKAPAVPVPAPAAGKPTIESGTYTVVLDGDYVTIRIAEEAWADGKVVASFLNGSDNEHSYKGFAFVNADGAHVWKRFADRVKLTEALDILLNNDPVEAHEAFLNLAEAYALKSGRCMRCSRKLTVPASLHRGLGPECANKEGV